MNFQDLKLIADTLLGRNKSFQWNYFELKLEEEDLSVINREIDFASGSIDWEKILSNTYGRKNFYRNRKVAMLINFLNKNPSLVLEITQEVFRQGQITNKSDAKDGMLGKFNEKNMAYRNSVFFEKMKKKGRYKKKVLLAEGDSWFQFPGIFLGIDLVEDLVDHLINSDEYLVYSLAYGGDWLANIAKLHEYVDQLPILAPDAFLLSGGGNDLVGSMRLATLVRNPFPHLEKSTAISIGDYLRKPGQAHLLKLLRLRIHQAKKTTRDKSIFDVNKYRRGLVFLSSEFFQFVNSIFVQYFLLINNIIHFGRNPDMKIITQGYDYVVPKKRHPPKGKMFNLWNNLANIANSNGNWLNIPLRLKGINDDDDQEAVMYVIIYEFNEMLIQLAEFKPFRNVFHIDSRGMASYLRGDWFDELHLTSKAYGRVKLLYDVCIAQDTSTADYKKVFTKSDLLTPQEDENERS